MLGFAKERELEEKIDCSHHDFRHGIYSNQSKMWPALPTSTERERSSSRENIINKHLGCNSLKVENGVNLQTMEGLEICKEKLGERVGK